jgi:hypothetical protein
MSMLTKRARSADAGASLLTESNSFCTGENLAVGKAKDRCIRVEGGLHVAASAGLGSVDVNLDRLGNRIIFAQTFVCVAHGFTPRLTRGKIEF